MERSLRKYSVLPLLKAVETTNLLQHNESVLSGAMKALSRWFHRCWYCRVTVVCSLTAFINVLNVVVCCSECQAHLCFYMAVFQSKNTVSNTELCPRYYYWFKNWKGNCLLFFYPLSLYKVSCRSANPLLLSCTSCGWFYPDFPSWLLKSCRLSQMTFEVILDAQRSPLHKILSETQCTVTAISISEDH